MGGDSMNIARHETCPLPVSLRGGRRGSIDRSWTGRERQDSYSTVTDFARFLGLSTSSPLATET